ncbi:unnamed protein product [Rotaria socialis]|uniref:Adenylyl cyclase-associated protein n=1 Tax=Rotaria socialis TaxID=392032 RepID=A0A817T471_9BILA|nr:unnamed protein product [Rotaria socialis]CAF4371674.1 unnamed protein product [Rotaria socialis]
MGDQLKRLEALADRLEAIANKLSSSSSLNRASAADDSTSNIDHLPIIRDYETLINVSIQPFVVLSQKIGGDLTALSNHVLRLFNAQQQFIREAIQSKKPNEKQLMDAIKPQSLEIEAILGFANKNRKSPFFNHLSTVSEGIPALSWILVTPTPGPHIKDMSDAAQFYSNRVLKEFREKDPAHVEWVKLWIKALNELYTYVRQYHTTGLAWASQSSRDFNFVSKPTTKPAAAGGGGPPPPPPPPPPPMTFDTNVDDSTDDSRNQLMSSINALGEGVTSHLKKVPDQLKTHKNPELRQQPDNQKSSHGKPVVPSKAGKTTSPSTTNTATTGPPKLVLDGNKWLVEYQAGKSDLRITDTNMRHSIYVYKCTNSTIVVEGKVNSITLDQCTKVGLQFTSVVSLVEFINCKSMKAQAIEHVPTVLIEKTDGCHIYLSKASLSTEFITSKSSEMSVNIPSVDDEYKEYPIPEQFKTSIKNGTQLVTIPNESAGV